MKISAQIVGNSLSPQNHRITSVECVLPRFILAELNTHRMFSKNSASSRAIPFAKMVQMVQDNPFIPIAWQKEHRGMQGTEYIDPYTDENCAPISDWLEARDKAVESARDLNSDDITKQLCNRLLEPFMWHKVLITATEWKNFFALRCPEYVDTVYGEEKSSGVWRSRKDYAKHFNISVGDKTDLQWLKLNKGQAEIHMMALAEAMWDALNESIPKQLQPGEWHIPYRDKISTDVKSWGEEGYKYLGKDMTEEIVKVSTAMAARASYTTVGDEKGISYERLVDIHDKMAVANPFHDSPFEHCARAMSDDEYYSFGKFSSHETYPKVSNDQTSWNVEQQGRDDYKLSEYGWCRNFRGFIQYRHILENNLNS